MKKIFARKIALPFFLAFVVIVGSLVPTSMALAQTSTGLIGLCSRPAPGGGYAPVARETEVACRARGSEYRWAPLITNSSGQVVGVANEQDNAWWLKNVIQPAVAWGVGMMLQFVAYLTGVAGLLLNGVVFYTIKDVAKNYGNLTPLNEAWRVIRDIANMSFIFVLLYEAIKTIIGQGGDSQKVIKNVVVAAVLINFSLFFTKVVIDISNVLALTFYDAIAPNAIATTGTLSWDQTGISNSFMHYLGVQKLYQVGETLGVANIITVGLMGTIMLLIAAFVFFAIAIMFVIRYVILILVMILSPIAIVAMALPKGLMLDKYKNQWVDALTGQAFFAPIYFAITWIALRVLDGVMGAFGGNAIGSATSTGAVAEVFNGFQVDRVDQGAFLLFINFTIVIILLIASLIIAKDFANKAGGGMSKLTGWATGVAGGATLGMAGRLGRQTLGRAGQAIADSDFIKRNMNDRGVGGRAARLAFAAGAKTGASSFDFRASRVGGETVGIMDGGKAKTGGFKQHREDIIKKRMSELGKYNRVITGTNVEEAMARNGWSKADNDRLGRNAADVETERIRVQRELETAANIENRARKDRFLHRLSQTRWFSRGYKNGVYTDAEAARRMRGKKKKPKKPKDDEDEWEDDNPSTPGGGQPGNNPGTPPPGNPRPNNPPPNNPPPGNNQNPSNNPPGGRPGGNPRPNNPPPNNPPPGNNQNPGNNPPGGRPGGNPRPNNPPPNNPNPGPNRGPNNNQGAGNPGQNNQGQQNQRRTPPPPGGGQRGNQNQNNQNRQSQQNQGGQTPPRNNAGQNDPYGTLGVNRNATEQEIKTAFRTKARVHHPDQFQDPAEKARNEDVMKEYTAAYSKIQQERGFR